MPIFGAKSRAARGCASKLACGRRIDPHAARPFLQYVAANLPLPNGRTGSSAPTGRCAWSPMARCNFVIAPCRGERGIDPYGRITMLPFVARFCRCTVRGRGKPLPYGSIGNTGKTHTSGWGKTTSKEGCSNEHPSFGTGDGNTPAALPPPCHPDFLLALLAQRAPLAAVQNPGGRTTVSLRRPRHQKAGRSGERPAFWYRRRESNPYGAMPGDFKSPVSTCSTTPAYPCILPFRAARVKGRGEKTPAVLFGRRADFQIAQALR